MSQDKAVNLYKSHDQTFTGYAMSRAPLKRSTSEEASSHDALARSLNKTFYTTSYQSEFAKYAGSGMQTSLIIIYTTHVFSYAIIRA